MTYFSNGIFRIGRNMGYGVGNVFMSGYLNVESYLIVSGTIQALGSYYFPIDRWNYDNNSSERIYFGGNATTYMRGYGSTCFQFRSGTGAAICEMYPSGGMWILGGLGQYSDSRIKMNIKDIDDEEALNLILAIEPKTYEYIDKKTMGYDTVYGFIAQQVKEVLPKAVQIVSGIPPNIYKICDCEGDIIYVNIPNDVLINTEIKLIDDKEEHLTYKILEIGDNYIKINKVLDVDNIFVYGYCINDFHRMTKDYIYTVNVCATQILSRRIDAQRVIIQSQDARIKELEAKMAQILNYISL
jgi:hypothetical protein